MSIEGSDPSTRNVPLSQSTDVLPDLIVQPRDDRWKRNTKKQTPPPRFGIQHLLLWTACWGVYMALTRRYLGNDPGVSSLLSVALFGVGYSAGLLGLAICLTRQVSGATWPIEPGEWLLMMIGAVFVFSEVQAIAFPNLFNSSFRVLTALRCLLLLVPILGQSMPWRWKYLFAVLLSIHLGVVTYLLLDGEPALTGRLGQFSALIIFHSNGALLDWVIPVFWSAFDYRNHSKYTWLHWLGIIAGGWLSGCVAMTMAG